MPDPTPQTLQTDEEVKPLPQVIGNMISVLVFTTIGLGIAWKTETGKAFLIHRRWWVAGGIALLLVLVASPGIRDRIAKITPKGKIGLIVYGVIPALIVMEFFVAFLPVNFQGLAVRWVFLIVVSLLPGIMFYLFIATRKDSLLNEFIANLDRLGLLTPTQDAATGPDSRRALDAARARKVYTYLLRFQAAYGPLRREQVEPILSASDPNYKTIAQSWQKTSFSEAGSIIAPETTVPVITATVLIALGWLVTLPPSGPRDAMSWLDSLGPEQTPVAFAFLGAYLFSVQLLFWRYVRRDLRPNAFMGVSLRIILALLGTWGALEASRFALSKEVAQTTQLVLAFTIGFFPRVAWQVIEAATKKIGGVVMPKLDSPLPVTDLAGLTVWHEARLQEEDVENIPNMATADMADLMLNTRFPPDRIVDWVDEAILYTYLGAEPGSGASPRSILRQNGVRSASGLIEAYYSQKDPASRAAFEKLLPASAEGASPIRTLVSTLPTNPNLELIQRWRNLTTESERRATLRVPLPAPAPAVP